jgi:hypothetical protein
MKVQILFLNEEIPHFLALQRKEKTRENTDYTENILFRTAIEINFHK